MLTTAYNRIAAALRARVLDGAWESGSRLPTERELCEQFKASRITVRRALQILEEEGLVERRQGIGTFVNPNPSRKIPLLTSDFTGSIESHAPDLQRRVESWRPAAADRETAKLLHVLPGEEVMEGVRVDSLDRTPVAMDRLYLVRAFSGHLTEDDLTRMNFLAEWARVQRLELAHCTQSIEATAAEAPEANVLGVSKGAILLKESNVVYLTGNTPIGVIHSFYRHDYFRFDSTIDLRSIGMLAKQYG